MFFVLQTFLGRSEGAALETRHGGKERNNCFVDVFYSINILSERLIDIIRTGCNLFTQPSSQNKTHSTHLRNDKQISKLKKKKKLFGNPSNVFYIA